MSDYSRPPSKQEIADDEYYQQLRKTPVSHLIENGITVHELWTVLNPDNRVISTELARKRRLL